MYPFPRPPIKTIPESIFARKILGLIDGGGPTTRNALLNIIPRRKSGGKERRGRRRGFVNVINHRSSRGIDQFTVSGSKSSKKTLQPFNRLITSNGLKSGLFFLSFLFYARDSKIFPLEGGEINKSSLINRFSNKWREFVARKNYLDIVSLIAI